MKRSFIIILVLFGSGIAKGQVSDTEKYLQLKGGHQKRVLLDEQKSALTYASNQLTAGFEFGRIGPNSIFTAAISAGIGNYAPANIKERWLFITRTDIHGEATIDSFPLLSKLISGSFQLSWQAKLNPDRKVVWLAGASLKDMLHYPDNYTGLLNSLGLHVKAGVIRNGFRSRFKSDISFPLVALNSRLPWHNTATSPDNSEIKTFFKKGSRMVSVDKFRMIEFNLHYDFKLNQKWSIGASYELNWFHLTYFRPMDSYSNSFQIQTTLIL